MKMFRKLKEWTLNQEFNQAVKHDTYTPDPVRDLLTEKGYEFKTDFYTSTHPMGVAYVSVTRATAFKGTPLSADPQLANQYEQERVKLVCAHYKKPYPPAAPGK